MAQGKPRIMNPIKDIEGFSAQFGLHVAKSHPPVAPTNRILAGSICKGLDAPFEGAMTTQQKPCAVSTKCGAVSYGINQINGPGNADGKLCRGLNRSRLNTTDWAECDGCAGSGRVSGLRCERCDGVGWIDVRR
jgi:hypothetical protein